MASDKEKREFVFLLNRGMEAIYEAQVLCRITFLHCVLPKNRCAYSINWEVYDCQVPKQFSYKGLGGTTVTYGE